MAAFERKGDMGSDPAAVQQLGPDLAEAVIGDPKINCWPLGNQVQLRAQAWNGNLAPVH